MNVKLCSRCVAHSACENRCTVRHPAWCDPAVCTADPASQVNEHRSVSIPLNLTTAIWIPVREGRAWLSEACAPWPCAVFLRVPAGDVELSLSADDAVPVLEALSALLALACPAEGVTR